MLKKKESCLITKLERSDSFFMAQQADDMDDVFQRLLTKDSNIATVEKNPTSELDK